MTHFVRRRMVLAGVAVIGRCYAQCAPVYRSGWFGRWYTQDSAMHQNGGFAIPQVHTDIRNQMHTMQYNKYTVKVYRRVLIFSIDNTV